MPDNREGRLIGNQIFRSGTSVAANYRAACRARSKTEFISKLSIAEEEADEALFWFELIQEMEILDIAKPHFYIIAAKNPIRTSAQQD